MPFRVPTDKHDVAAAETVLADQESAADSLPELMAWLQDSNWPAAQSLAPVLPRLGHPFVLALRDVLRQQDATWAWHALTLLSPHLLSEQRAALMPDLQRLARSPSAEGLADIARQALSTHP
jgi:hypothetical protein